MIPSVINATTVLIAAASGVRPSAFTEDVDALASSIFETFHDVVELSTPKIREMFPLMIEFGLEVVLRQSSHMSEISADRESAAEFITTCILLRPKAVKKAKLISACIEAALQLTCESERGNCDAEMEGTKNKSAAFVLTWIRSLSLSLSASFAELPPTLSSVRASLLFRRH